MKSLSGGFNLIDEGPDLWVIQEIGNERYFRGSFKAVIIFAVLQLGFNIDELDLAVTSMIEEDMNSSRFGMGKCFLFTFETEFVEVKKAS